MSRIALVGGMALDAVHGRRTDHTVVIDGDRIAEVGPAAEVGTEEADEIVDLAGRTVMPGMISCHFHSTYDELGSRPTPLGLDHAPAYLALIGARNMAT
ncbi:MAG: hypothetical protein AAGK32_09470, partial [Actinomycetota bacterium]